MPLEQGAHHTTRGSGIYTTDGNEGSPRRVQ